MNKCTCDQGGWCVYCVLERQMENWYILFSYQKQLSYIGPVDTVAMQTFLDQTVSDLKEERQSIRVLVPGMKLPLSNELVEENSIYVFTGGSGTPLYKDLILSIKLLTVPQWNALPEELRRIVTVGSVEDFTNYVKKQEGGQS